MDSTIENLFTTFALYRIGDDFTGCDHCVGPGDSAKLAAPALRDLTYDDLEKYSRKAMTTWGDARHFKHFLPRLLELTIEHRDDFLDLAVVFGKLSYASWEAWPRKEKEAITRFLDDYWRYQLDVPIDCAFEDTIDTVLCALSNACSSVQPFLDMWLITDTDNAKRHLAAFILSNDDTLLKKWRLSNAFWDTSGKPHEEVLNWLLTDKLLGYFEVPNDSVFIDDFSYAWPQLIAIRASLASVQN